MQAMSHSDSPREASVTPLPGADARHLSHAGHTGHTADAGGHPGAAEQILDRLAAFELVLRRVVERLARTETQLLEAIEQRDQVLLARLDALRADLHESNVNARTALDALARVPAPAGAADAGEAPVEAAPVDDPPPSLRRSRPRAPSRRPRPLRAR